MNTPLENRMLEYRRDNFAVVVRPAQNPPGPGEVAMEITHNGYQWTNICLLPEEAKKVAEALLANTTLSRDAGADAAKQSLKT